VGIAEEIEGEQRYASFVFGLEGSVFQRTYRDAH
jgi:hypothetical protein